MCRKQYKSVGHPESFEFHDSVWALDHMDGNDISVYVHGLNLKKDTELNPKGYDLEILQAHILFHGVSDCTYNPGRTWKTDTLGNIKPEGAETIYRGKEAIEKTTEVLQEENQIFSHSIVDGKYIRIYGCGIEPFFEIRFRAQEITVEWDEYRGPAWYESTRQYKRDLLLNTANGESSTSAHIIIRYDPKELNRVDSIGDVDPKEISVGIKLDAMNFWGQGKDCSGKDAFADLQKKLPDGISLKCCLSCRHGNQSPFSNAFDLLYCMKDAVITGKEDLFKYIQDPSEMNNRSRHYTDVCEDWAEQDREAFVYSDYPVIIEKSRQSDGSLSHLCPGPECDRRKQDNGR